MTNPLIGQPRFSASSLVRFGDVVQTASDGPALSVDGVVQPARWAQWYVPTVGDPVAFVVMAGAEGQSSNLVLGKVASSPAVTVVLPDEALVTSVPASSPTITVTASGVTMTAKFVGTAPTVGDTVLLDHRLNAIYVVGKVGVTAAPPPPTPVEPPEPPAPPPGPSTTGTDVFGATDSGTARVGAGWNSPSGQNLTQGSWGGSSYAGSWFYGTGPSSLTGRGIRAARLYMPARRRMGSYNDAVPIHVYGHNASARPGGDVTRVAGPADVMLPPGWGGGWVDIPPGLAAVVVGGGGLGIVGDPYAGLVGRGEDPQSGALAIDWTT